jgi:hypothetical protein
MKKIAFILAISAGLTACNSGNSNSNGDPVDSLDSRKDTLTHNVDSTTNARVDSIKTEGKEMKQKFDSSIDAKKDSVKGKK